jgi:hypothetical protein
MAEGYSIEQTKAQLSERKVLHGMPVTGFMV